MKKLVVAIDGPAGAGKSTVGKAVASAVGYKFVSTGKMYRALAWKALQTCTPLDDERKLLDLADSMKWTFPKGEGPEADVALDGRVLRKKQSFPGSRAGLRSGGRVRRQLHLYGNLH